MNLPSPPSIRLALTAIVPALCHFCGNGRVFNCVDGLSAGRLSSVLCFWTAPDPLAQRFADTSPYIYSSANPVKFIGPSGCEIRGVHKSDAKRGCVRIGYLWR